MSSGEHKTSLAMEQRQAAWNLMAGLPEFTAAMVSEAMGASEAWGRKVVREWRDDGLIQAARQDGQTVVWQAIEKPQEAESEFASERKRPEFAMWRTMRQLRRFRANDVHLYANTEETPLDLAQVQKYCSTLAEAGFLRVAVKGKIGARAAVYAINGKPGPFPPRPIRVPAIYDPNEKSFHILERRVRP